MIAGSASRADEFAKAVIHLTRDSSSDVEGSRISGRARRTAAKNQRADEAVQSGSAELDQGTAKTSPPKQWRTATWYRA